jgi:arylsulfatase A-like enzyme
MLTIMTTTAGATIRAAAAGRPFLMALWAHYIHLPHPAMPDNYRAAVASGDPDYIGALAQFDAAVGRIRQVLRTHGVANNTLLWLTSDNGPHCKESPLMCGGPIGVGRSNAGLRGCKASVWEGGIRVPGIVEWPAGIASHRSTTVPAVTMDILPTIMDILGVNSTHPS